MPQVPRHLDVHIIMDNYGTHKTPLIRNWFAKRPRFHVHFTPTYGSWLNLVERWFAELTNKQLRRGVHRSVAQLKAGHSGVHRRASCESEAVRLDENAPTRSSPASRDSLSGPLDAQAAPLIHEPRGQDTSQ